MTHDRRLADEQMAHSPAPKNRAQNTKDITEASAHNVPQAQRGVFWKARKEAISLRLDMDVLDWLRRQGPGYQTTINRILRERMEAETG